MFLAPSSSRAVEPYLQTLLLRVSLSRHGGKHRQYTDLVESSQDSLDFITNALAKMQLKSCQNHTLAELLDDLREVASIDDLPFQYGTPLATEKETGSGETVLADYDSDLEFGSRTFGSSDHPTT